MAHLSPEALFSKLNLAKQKVIVGAKYYHYKHPELYYSIVDLVIIEATEEVGVLYRAEYESLKGLIFMRPIDDFLATVEVEDRHVGRFALA